jgi:hypothetical protein
MLYENVIDLHKVTVLGFAYWIYVPYYNFLGLSSVKLYL